MRSLLTRMVVLAILIALNAPPANAINPSKTGGTETSTTGPSIESALSEFRSLSRKEKKERYKEVRKLLKELKAAKKSGAEPSTNTVLLAILAVLLPPLAVYLHEGEINNRFWISLLLTLLFWLPGVIYALIIVLS